MTPAPRLVLLTALVGLAVAAPLARAQTAVPAARGGEELLERTLAIVGGAVVTQSDVSLALTLGLVDVPAVATPEVMLAALVDRWLMLHEVARFAPAEPSAAAVEARLAALRARAGDPDEVARRLSDAGRSASYLTAWVRDDLRIAAYLEQRFASTGTPSEPDVAAYAQRQAAEFAAAGLTGDAALAAARARLVQERRRELIADWLADLRRRTGVVTFTPRP
jgi:hypothetical protein